MSRVQQQDVSAFEELFRRYDQRIFAFFWRLCANRQEAEDGAQETFLRLWKARVLPQFAEMPDEIGQLVMRVQAAGVRQDPEF